MVEYGAISETHRVACDTAHHQYGLDSLHAPATEKYCADNNTSTYETTVDAHWATKLYGKRYASRVASAILHAFWRQMVIMGE